MNGSLAVNIFTDQELKEKEIELLELIKKTIIEFNKAWIRKKNQAKESIDFFDGRSEILKDNIKFNNYKIFLKMLNSTDGAVIFWGRKSRCMKIIFDLTSPNLMIKIDSFVSWPIQENNLIKEILYRMNIKSQEEYNKLIKKFEALIVSYI